MRRGICVALSLLGGSVMASPRSDPTSGRAVFTGATMPGALSIDLNPAAFGNGPTDEIFLGAAGVIDRYAIDLAGQSGVRDVELSPGGLLAYIRHFGSRFVVGFEFGSPPAEHFVKDHDVLRYHVLGGYHRLYRGGAAVEVKASSRVSIGISIVEQTSRLRLRYALDTALEMGSPDIGNPAAAERFNVDVRRGISQLDAIANFGVLVRLGKETWLGVGYHAPPGLAVDSDLDGEMTVVRPANAGGDVVHGDATIVIANPASLDAELRTRVLPDLDLHVGARWEDLSRFRSYSVRGFGSTFMPNNIPEWIERPRGFHDPLALWAGVEQVDPASRWHFGGRLGLETSALADDRTSPLTIAPTSFTADIGAQLAIPPFVLEATYGLQYFPTVSVSHSAFDPQAQLDCIANGMDYSTNACESVRNGYAIPSANGDYGRMEHAFRFGLRYELD